jgi:putative PEP-CTERM system histidine kinase
MPLSLPDIAYGTAFLAYAAFALYLLPTAPGNWARTLFAIAAAITALWSTVPILAELGLVPAAAADIVGTLRDGAWYALVLAVIRKADLKRSFWQLLALGALTILAVHLWFVAGHVDLGRVLGVTIDDAATGVAEAIFGLILVENMMRNLPADQFWSTKHLGIALLAFLMLQLLIRVPQFITGVPLEVLVVARPLLLAMLVPLFAVSAARSPALELRLPSSRTVVFQTATLVVAGVLLEGAAIAAYYLRTVGGGDSGTVVAIVFGFGAAAGTLLVIMSGSARSHVRAFINENFFRYKYDYRLEWDKFIRALSAWDDGDLPLRVLRTLAELLDSPGGVLWVSRERWHEFTPVAHWSVPREIAPLKLDDPRVAIFAHDDRDALEVGNEDDADARVWREHFPQAWLVVPLRYRGKLSAIASINPPRAPRNLDWEDRNLISLVALQLAAYLVQEETAQALADARQLAEFNKRFAFIIHDTKNAIGQLSLLVRNVEQFGHIESFRNDMTETLRHSVEKLQQLLRQLRCDEAVERPSSTGPGIVNITALVSSFVHEKRKLGLNVVMEEPAPSETVAVVDREAFLGVLELVITNAVDASPSGSPVTVQVCKSDKTTQVKVIDRGPGMSQEFVAHELFRPLRSTRRDGLGIGAYQAREVMGELGGRLDVDSKLGGGTTVSLSIPADAADRSGRRVIRVS